MTDETKLTKEWSEFDHKKGYEKRMQDVKLKNGDILFCCWPNAGVWMICDEKLNPKNKGQEISVRETTHVRLTNNRSFNEE